jgi:hypothetical protein
LAPQLKLWVSHRETSDIVNDKTRSQILEYSIREAYISGFVVVRHRAARTASCKQPAFGYRTSLTRAASPLTRSARPRRENFRKTDHGRHRAFAKMQRFMGTGGHCKVAASADKGQTAHGSDSSAQGGQRMARKVGRSRRSKTRCQRSEESFPQHSSPASPRDCSDVLYGTLATFHPVWFFIDAAKLCWRC